MVFRLPGLPILLLAPALLAGSCSLAPSWQAAEAGRVQVRVEPGLDPALAPLLASWLQEDAAVLAERLHLPVPGSELLVYCGRGSHEGGLLGLRDGESGRFVVSPGGRPRIELGHTREQELRTLLRHELTHWILEGHGFPEWLNEGLAEYLSFELAERPSPEDLHHLLHGGLVLAGWGQPLEVVLPGGRRTEVRLRNWLPELPRVLAMDYADYEREVLAQAALRDPEFHTGSHLLVRVLLESGGPGAHLRYLEALRTGTGPWEAYLQVTGLAGEEEVTQAASEALARALEEAPEGRAAEAAFARCSCLQDRFLESGEVSILAATQVSAFPGGGLQEIRPR